MAAQVPDRILYNQEYYDLCTNPLELYWIVRRKKRPRFIVKEECKRGYVATWEIKDNQLYLRDIEGTVKRSFALWGKNVAPYTMRKLFGGLKRFIKAAWYSGKLRIPAGPMVMFADNEYDSRYAKEIIVTVKNGNVDKIVTLDKENQRLTVNEEVSVRSAQ